MLKPIRRDKITERLLERGKELWNAPRGPDYAFTDDDAANHLLNDLEGHPHAFLIGCICDRQVKAERAWLVPYLFERQIGSFAFEDIEAIQERRWVRMLAQPKGLSKDFSVRGALHRFPETIGKSIHSAVRRVRYDYQGDAAKIWSGQPSSAELVFRFLEFDGVGPKIGNMAANILVRTMKVRLSDYLSIDVSVDVHLRRVLRRLGLVRMEATNEEFVYKCRAINPKFPGLLDFPAYEIGKSWCRPRKPHCSKCYVSNVCPKVGVQN